MKKILVIEDNWILQESICSLLEREGFATLGAMDGDTGINLARHHLPDLILCDIQMPDMNGYEVLAALRHEPLTMLIPFIFITAKGSTVDVRQGMNLGADDYITKPFESDELLKAITTRLDKQSIYQTTAQNQVDSLRNHIVQFLPHEFKTPLTTLLACPELLRGDANNPSVILDIADIIESATNRLHRLVSNYLLYAKLLATRTTSTSERSLLENQTTYSDFIIHGIATELAQRCGRAADLQFGLQPIPLAIAEKNLLKILEELLDNAFKFSRPNTPVQINSTVMDSHAAITITNQGRGMTVEQIARVGAYNQFERDFYEQQGLGLGLAIAKCLLETNGGCLEITSIPNQEITVSAIIPMLHSPQEN